MRNLLIAGGPHHPVGDVAPAVTAAAESLGLATDVFDDIEVGCRALGEGSYRLLTFAALRWTMLNNEKYAPQRAQWGFSLSPAGRAAIRRHLERGGALVALHAASISFDDWPEWGDIVGARWEWGRSGHRPYGPVEVRPCGPAHPITAGVPAFRCDDEVYAGLAVDPRAQPLMEARAGDDAWSPVLWAREWHGARVVYDALGHDPSSLDHATHRDLMRRAAAWALRMGSPGATQA
jgi:type 1 glutamine amidotransferase